MSERRTFVSIEIEMGCDAEWHVLGLEARPEDAASLLAHIKDESHDRIRDFIRDWSLDDFVTVRLDVTHNQDGKGTRTTALWRQP